VSYFTSPLEYIILLVILKVMVCTSAGTLVNCSAPEVEEYCTGQGTVLDFGPGKSIGIIVIYKICGIKCYISIPDNIKYISPI